MSTDRLHPKLEKSVSDAELDPRSTPTETQIYLPLETFIDHPLAPDGSASWLEVIRYWVDELRWWRKHWGGGPL